jgi:hypothetical protein
MLRNAIGGTALAPGSEISAGCGLIKVWRLVVMAAQRFDVMQPLYEECLFFKSEEKRIKSFV